MKHIIYLLLILAVCNLAAAASIIITPDSLYDKAVELSSFHSSKSITSQIVNISAISAGYNSTINISVDGSDTQAIPYSYDKSLAKKIISYLQAKSFDNIILFGDSSLIPPSYYVYDKDGADATDKWIPTDLFYSSPDLDIDVDIPVGRIPVKTSQEADNYLNKLTKWYSDGNMDKITLAGSDPTSNYKYYGEIIVSEIAAELAGKNITKLYSTNNNFNRQNISGVFESSNVGLLYLVGHGSYDYILLDDGAFDSQDVLSLSQAEAQPIVLSSLCSNGAFDTSVTGQSKSIGETMITHSSGASAFIGSSRLSYGLPALSYEDGEISIAETRHTSELMKRIILSYKTGQTSLGAITGKALNDYISDNNMSSAMDKRTVFEFVLLGDPSMKIPVYNQSSHYTKPDLTALNPTTPAAIPHYRISAGQGVSVGITTNSPGVDISLLRDSAVIDSAVKSDSYTFNPASDGLYLIIAEGADRQETRMVVNVSITDEYDPVSFIVPGLVNFPESERNVTISKQIEVINKGNKKIANITVSSNADYIYNLTITPSRFDLDINESKLITITSFISPYTDSGISKITSLNFKSAEFSKSIDLNSNAKNKIEITGITAYSDGKKKTVSTGTMVDVKPGSEFSVEVEVENLFEDVDIDRAALTLNISELSYDADRNDYKDVTADSGSFFIRESRKKEGRVKLLLPKIVAEGLHDVLLSVEATDDNGAKHTASSRFLLNIEKEDYELEITKLELDYETINCESVAELYIGITNTGEKDADVVLSITSPKLGIGIYKDIFLASEIYSELNTYSQTLEINGENIDQGQYPVTVRVERDDKLEDSKTIILTVSECPEEAEEQITESDISAQQNIGELNQQVFTSSKSFRQTSTYKMLIVIIAVLWTGLIVFVIGALIIVAGKRR